MIDLKYDNSVFNIILLVIIQIVDKKSKKIENLIY